MCIFIDVNQFQNFIKKTDDMKPIHYWLNKKNGKLVFSNHHKFQQEFQGKNREKLLQYNQAGKVKLIKKSDIENKLQYITQQQYELKSDDEHIIALCLAENIQIIVTGDKSLHSDYKKYISKGNIYQSAKHKHLLQPDICP